MSGGPRFKSGWDQISLAKLACRGITTIGIVDDDWSGEWPQSPELSVVIKREALGSENRPLAAPWSSVTRHIVVPTGLVSSLDQLVQQDPFRLIQILFTVSNYFFH